MAGSCNAKSKYMGAPPAIGGLSRRLMQVLALVAAVSSVLLAAGCEREESRRTAAAIAEKPASAASIAAAVIDPAQFAAHVRARRLNTATETAQSAAEASFIKREKLVSAMLAQKTLDTQLLDADVNEYRSELIVNRYFAQLLEGKTGSEQLRTYFEEHGADFLPYRARIATLLIKLPAGDPSSGYESVLSAQRQIAEGEPFEAVVSKFSSERVPSAGWIESARLPTQIEAVVRRMRNGEVSAPIATAEGVAIVKLLSELEFEQRPFESMVDQVRARVRYVEREKEAERLLGLVGYAEAAEGAQLSATK
jgi:parvulin-like peptidyl-prolyl isomerase